MMTLTPHSVKIITYTVKKRNEASCSGSKKLLGQYWVDNIYCPDIGILDHNIRLITSQY